MARQMIFTSTPQGLEPGRTGFCTVARHRSLRSRLVRELERHSVYEFNLGEGATKAKINSFRRFELGSEEFYVLTRIRDAGLDYTNRTNYIAHHLIFDGLEIAVSPSPPEIFLQWTGWLDVWEGSPRWFEDDEITDVSSCKMTGLSPAQSWQNVTGDGGNAAYLIAEKAKRPILLETHPGQEDDLLQLFAESSALFAMPMEAWQSAFTTYLQETDDSRDFAWIGGCGQTASLRLKQNGVPNHLDFTAFDQGAIRDPMDEKQVFIARNGRKAAIKKTPPPPPVVESAGAGSATGEVGESTRISEGRATAGGGFSRSEKEQFRQVAASHAAAQATVTSQGEGGKKQKKRAKWPWISALAAVMLLAVFIVLKSGVLDIFTSEVVDPNLHSRDNGQGKGNGNGKSPDSPLLTQDPVNKPPGVQAGVPALAKVTAKDERLGTWIEFTVGQSPPNRIDIAAMSDVDYTRFGDKLGALEVGQEMAVTFRNGKQSGTFLLAGLAPPSSLVQTVPSGTNSSPLTNPSNPIRLPSTPVPRKSDFSASDVGVVEDNFMLSFVSPQGVRLKYVFPPERRVRFQELREHLAAGRKVTFIWSEDQGRVRAFDFSVQVPVVNPAVTVPVSVTAPPAFPVVGSHVLWLTKGEVEDPQLESVSAHGDAAFAQSLRTALSRIAASRGAFVWETDYTGAQSLVNTPLMEGAQRYVAIYDARVKELLGIERYTLETPQDEGSTLFLRFLFKSPSEVSVIFENQRARNAASRGVVLRLPDPQTNRSIDLYLLSPRVVGNKPNELPKAHLTMKGNRVSLAKKGAFGHGLRVVGSTGPRTLRLSVNQSDRVFYGTGLSPNDFTNRRLLSFPHLLVKPVAEDSLTCELALFIDYMTDLRKKFQQEISSLHQKATGDHAAKMPIPKIYEALERFGARAGFAQGNYKPGTGVGSFGPHVIAVVLEFFRKVHDYSPAAVDKLRSDLALDPRKFYLNDLEYREFWRKVCLRAKEEAFRPFGLGYDPKHLSRDIDRVIGTLRFLREAERAFGVKDQGIGAMIFAVVREIIEPNKGAVKKLYDQLITHKATAEARAATPKYTQEWNRYLQDFAEVHAPVELTSAELRKGIVCIENPELVKMYKEHLFDQGTTKRQLGPLKQWYALLETEISKKDPRIVPLEYEPARKLRVMNSYFHAEEWSLRLFRQGQFQPEAELIHFK